jgi:hypothetical protein
MRHTTLYRPVGKAELELVEQSGWLQFPPRLSHQPIFYAILDEGYAIEIARDWDAQDEASGFEGHVLCFEVESNFLDGFMLARAGGKTRREYWIPAEYLEMFNSHICGKITVIASFGKEDQ